MKLLSADIANWPTTTQTPSSNAQKLYTHYDVHVYTKSHDKQRVENISANKSPGQ